ncbi:hypothetical protein P154DRAFT_517697 [Amniculicola lignicola CBS 123094]|uniref:Fibronectin type-III domain-containing protein n=1 Tax=Amniculicola lignicola CBS 123094 TaxID=1392246 RepID=A0A6A5WZQ0_9PLEO|nr:hypothetical protein P154DRAFT_517697 [Amniculicola lignicola CBS 123094]
MCQARPAARALFGEGSLARSLACGCGAPASPRGSSPTTPLPAAAHRCPPLPTAHTKRQHPSPSPPAAGVSSTPGDAHTAAAPMLSDSPNALYHWPPDVLHYNMEALVFLSSGWLKTACVLSALFWVAYRGYQVLSKPVEELVALLGLEVPVAPIVSLAGIRADGVLLHWKPPDQRASVLKYVIRINGIDIGDVSPQETSVTIENLQPDHHYVIRIVTLNSANFQAPSVPIRLRTLPASSDQFYNTAPQKDREDGGDDEEYTPTPIIRPNKNLADIIIPPAVAPVMAREHSNSTSRVRRTEPARRNSPASQTVEQARSAKEVADSIQTIKSLTEKLDSLRREIDDVERQIQDEDEEFGISKISLQVKRDEKKLLLKEKEDASRDLRKEVASLERTNTSAQTRRAQQEKLLRQKEAERTKFKDDTLRWARETVELHTAADRIAKEHADLEVDSEERLQALKEKHAEELQANKCIEEAIREKGTQIKSLEEDRKQLEESDEAGDPQDGTEPAEADEDRRWIATLTALQQRYAHAWALFTEAERANVEATSRLHFLQQRRLSQPQLFTGSQELVPTRRSSIRTRPVSMREPLISAAPGGFVHSAAPPFSGGIPGASPSFPAATPYFNINNGMAIALPNHMTTFSQAEIDNLTGGAPMSPTAGALLPSGLFGDDRTDTDDENDPGPPQQSSVDPSPNLHHVLPGLGAPGTLEHAQGPSSPVSVQSRSPSVFASPRESAGQLQLFPSAMNDNVVESDRRSIRSTSSSFMMNPPTTRFGSLFGLNRQRGKTLSEQGPPLGSLKASQSQSLPRQDPGGLDEGQRRGSHSGGAWYESFLRTKTQPVESSSSPKHVVTRKRPFNMFGTKADPWLTSALGLERGERPSSPRQGSTNSSEMSGLPRPSTENQARWGWPVDTFGARNSPLGAADWSVNNTTTSWSRMPSRRPSMQHGSTVSLIHEDLLQGDTPDFTATTRSPTQAPIGTRPQSSASFMPPTGLGTIPATPPKALNPTAPHFKSIFIRGEKSEEDKAEKAKKAAEKAAEKEAKKAEKNHKKESAKAEKSEKAMRKEKEKLLASEAAANDSGKDSASPLTPRKSRDNRSLSTADISDASPRESLERSLSHTPSESQSHTNSVGRETFMQKLTRKSSSSQFLGFGKNKASLFSKKPTDVVTPDETEEDAGGLLARSVDSAGNSPSIGTPKDRSSALSWSSIKRMGKRGDKTPSLHESIASEATGDEEEDYAEGIMGTT